jgi:hypothetical protein
LSSDEETRPLNLINMTSILLATGDSWRAQRNAGMVLVSPPNLKRFTEETLPAHLPVLLGPLEAAANSGQAIDFDEVTGDYSLAVFGEIAFDVSFPFTSALWIHSSEFRQTGRTSPHILLAHSRLPLPVRLAAFRRRCTLSLSVYCHMVVASAMTLLLSTVMHGN